MCLTFGKNDEPEYMKCGLSEKPAAVINFGALWPSSPDRTSISRPRKCVRHDNAAGRIGWSSVPCGIYTSNKSWNPSLATTLESLGAGISHDIM